MERFVPAAKERFSEETMALLNLIYDHPDEIEVWRSALSSYISVYPYQILSYFTQFAFGPDAAEKMEQFAIQDRKEVLPGILKQIAECRNRTDCADLVLWLGIHYAFEIVDRYHRAVASES